jgi:hypothetical protein
MSKLATLSKLTVLFAVVFVTGNLLTVIANRDGYEKATSQTSTGGLTIRTDSLTSAFVSGGAVSNAGYAFQDIYCASEDGRYRFCPANTNRGVRLVRVRSDASCIQGQSWGYNRRGIWVDRGCRADFELGGVRGRPGRGPGGNSRGGSTQVFYCESGDMKRHYCAEGKSGRVRLVRQRSDAPCIEGQTWGRDRSGFRGGSQIDSPQKTVGSRQ